MIIFSLTALLRSLLESENLIFKYRNNIVKKHYNEKKNFQVTKKLESKKSTWDVRKTLRDILVSKALGAGGN